MSLIKALFEELSTASEQFFQGSHPIKDLEKNIKGLINAAFASMDIITRQEYDFQQRRLKKLAAQVAELESQLATLNHADSVSNSEKGDRKFSTATHEKKPQDKIAACTKKTTSSTQHKNKKHNIPSYDTSPELTSKKSQ